MDNQLHFVRDIVLGEDVCRVRWGHGPHVFAAARNAALDRRRGAWDGRIASAT